VDGVNFSLIWTVIFRAIRSLSVFEKGWVLRLRVWLRSEGEDIVRNGIVGSWEICGFDTI
jgi:hypothetical protein